MGVRAGVRFLGLVTVILLASTFTPLPNLAARWIEIPARLERADAIVVLGTGVTSDGALEDRSLRGAMHGILLRHDGLAPLLVFSGTRAGPYHEAEVRARLAWTLGVPADAILTETGARTTHQEAARIAARLRPRGVKTILLISTPFHLPRAVPLFERAGFAVFPAPTFRASETLKSPEERARMLVAVLTEAAARLYHRIGESLSRGA